MSATHRYEVRRPEWARGGLAVLSRMVALESVSRVGESEAHSPIEMVLAVKSGDLVLSRPFTKSEMSPSWGSLALTDMDKAQVARFAEGARHAEMQATVLTVIGKIFDGRDGGRIGREHGLRTDGVLPDWEYDLLIWTRRKTWTESASSQFTDRQIEALKDLLENLREAIRPVARDSGALLARDPGGMIPSFFDEQDAVVDSIRNIADTDRADETNFDPAQEYAASGIRDNSEHYIARRVAWLGSPGHMVKVSAECVRFTPENTWNLAHAAAIYQAIRAADTSEPIRLRPPAGRVYRIDAGRLKDTQKRPEEWGMVRGFTRAYLGEYMVQLLDGNHRAAAAIAAREPFIWAYCGEDYLPNVKKGDLR